MFTLTIFDNNPCLSILLQKHFEANKLFVNTKAFCESAPFFQYLKKKKSDIIIIDHLNQDIAGIELINMIKKSNPKSFIANYSNITNTQIIRKLHENGVNLHVNKSASLDELIRQIEKNMEVSLYESDSLKPSPLLTQKEKKIVSSLAHGYSSKQIANLFGNSTSTINNQKNKILQKLKCKNSSELMVQLISLGYLKI